MITVERDFRFEAAHHLPLMAPNHKCRRPHGHSYKVTIACDGERDPRGCVVDFDALDGVWLPIHEQLDHRCLNNVQGLACPTAEVIAEWIATAIRVQLAALVHCWGGGRVTVHETDGARAIVAIAK